MPFAFVRRVDSAGNTVSAGEPAPADEDASEWRVMTVTIEDITGIRAAPGEHLVGCSAAQLCGEIVRLRWLCGKPYQIEISDKALARRELERVIAQTGSPTILKRFREDVQPGLSSKAPASDDYSGTCACPATDPHCGPHHALGCERNRPTPQEKAQ